MKAWKEWWRLRDMARPWLLFLQLLVLLLSHQASAFSQTFGIAPQDLKYYEGLTFRCKDGSRKVSKDRLNDNFCDCEDGTDEPGTSACPKGLFYCKNTGHTPQRIFSSRVNDGICDCCDGTDEYDGQVKCANTCWEAGKVSRDKLVKKLNTYKDGLKIRRSEVEDAKTLRHQHETKLTTLRREAKTLSDLVQKLKVEKETIEERERREEAAREKKEKEEADKKAEEEKAAAPVETEESTADNQPELGVEEVKSDDISKDETGDVDDTHYTNEAETGSVTEEPKEDAPEVHLTELEQEPDLQQLSKEDLGRVVAARWTGEDTTVHVPEEPTHNHAENSDEDQENEPEHDHEFEPEHDYSEEDEYAADREDKHLSEPVISREPIKSAWWDRFVPGMLKILFTRQPVDKSEAERIRKRYSEATDKLSNMQNQISELETKLKEDFGPDGEFYSFYDKCFELKVKKYVMKSCCEQGYDTYTYKVCAYRQATQEEGHMTTRLGTWDGFKDNYTAMMFSSGDRCWNGPDRSLRVKLRCGLKNELRNVDEPSRCDYVAELVTPAFCLESRVQVLEDFHNSFVRKAEELLRPKGILSKWRTDVLEYGQVIMNVTKRFVIKQEGILGVRGFLNKWKLKVLESATEKTMGNQVTLVTAVRKCSPSKRGSTPSVTLCWQSTKSFFLRLRERTMELQKKLDQQLAGLHDEL